MKAGLSRRTLTLTAAVALAMPALNRRAWAAEPLLLRCSLDTVPSHARNASIRGYLQQIEKASDGRIKTQLFESGQLFPDLQVGKALLQDQVEMAVPGSWTLTGIIPDADFFQLPTLYGRPIDLIHQVVDGRPGELLEAQIERRLRSHVIGPWLDLGFFNWYSTSRAVNTYADLKGMKIRNAGGAGQAWRTQFVGAIPNTTPLPNVPLALSQGTFDGLITTNETVASGQFWESGIRHAFEDHQFIGEYIPMISLTFWHKLSPDLQNTVTRLWKKNISGYRAKMAEAQTRAREIMQAHGVTIVAPSEADLDAMRDKMMADEKQLAATSKISADMVTALAASIGAQAKNN